MTRHRKNTAIKAEQSSETEVQAEQIKNAEQSSETMQQQAKQVAEQLQAVLAKKSTDVPTLLKQVIDIVRAKATRIEYASHAMYPKSERIGCIISYNHTTSDSILVVYTNGTRKYMSIKEDNIDAEELQSIYDEIKA